MKQGESRKAKVGSKYPDAPRARGLIRCLQSIAQDVKAGPGRGYTKPRKVYIGAWDECDDGGGESVSEWKMDDADMATLLKACALLLPPAKVRSAR